MTQIEDLITRYVLVSTRLKELSNFTSFRPDDLKRHLSNKGFDEVTVNLVAGREGGVKVFIVYPHKQHSFVFFLVMTKRDHQKDICSGRTSYIDIIDRVKPSIQLLALIRRYIKC
jgi:hypothetical protein